MINQDGATMSDESERRQQILEAATEEFVAKGFLGATIKDIAQRAKLRSQALIYWYFPTKEALFEAVLGAHLPIFQLVLDASSLRERPPEEVLPLLARSFLAGADQPAAHRVMRLVAPEVIRRPEVADLIATHLIGRVLDFLKTYLGHQIELGRLRPHDVRASSRAFIGMLLPQLGGKLVFPALQADELTDEEHIDTIIAIFLHGLRPDDAPSSSGEEQP
jgi:TetR/AcrR family transcriptional regulator, regulator of autoinduction and epiphytic fitness